VTTGGLKEGVKRPPPGCRFVGAKNQAIESCLSDNGGVLHPPSGIGQTDNTLFFGFPAGEDQRIEAGLVYATHFLIAEWGGYNKPPLLIGVLHSMKGALIFI
jgi:hypothetical protein